MCYLIMNLIEFQSLALFHLTKKNIISKYILLNTLHITSFWATLYRWIPCMIQWTKETFMIPREVRRVKFKFCCMNTRLKNVTRGKTSSSKDTKGNPHLRNNKMCKLQIANTTSTCVKTVPLKACTCKLMIRVHASNSLKCSWKHVNNLTLNNK